MNQILISTLKGILSLTLVAVALYAGLMRLPFESIFAISLLFTVAYIQSKWHLWQSLFQTPGRKLYQSLLITYLIQLAVVAVFYALGSGLARLLDR